MLSPDMLWLQIMQGFAIHVNQNVEKLRKLFVDYEGKKKIVVRRDGFVLGSKDNNWEVSYLNFLPRLKRLLV